MATIIAGRLQLQKQAEEVVEQLTGAGFLAGKVTSFYLNPPGQHAVYPIGGDRAHSVGLEEPGNNGAFGEVIAEAAEAVIGSGVHGGTQREDNSEGGADANKARNECAVEGVSPDVRLRKAGMLVAVELADQADQDRTVALLTQLGAKHIEQAEGKIVDGVWMDFDPLSEPCYISGVTAHGSRYDQ